MLSLESFRSKKENEDVYEFVCLELVRTRSCPWHLTQEWQRNFKKKDKNSEATIGKCEFRIWHWGWIYYWRFFARRKIRSEPTYVPAQTASHGTTFCTRKLDMNDRFKQICLNTQYTSSACTFSFSKKRHVIFSREFSLCLISTYICTCRNRNIKELFIRRSPRCLH